MKEKIRTRFIFKSAIIILVATTISYFILPYFNSSFRWFIVVLPTITFLINLFAFVVASGKSAQKNFNLQISYLFGIKFFAYLLICLFLFMKEPSTPVRLIFISFIFVLYLSNTVVLLTDIMKLYKSASNS